MSVGHTACHRTSRQDLQCEGQALNQEVSLVLENVKNRLGVGPIEEVRPMSSERQKPLGTVRER